MLLEIKSNLDLLFKSDVQFQRRTNTHQIFLFGNLRGKYEGFEFTGKEETFSNICHGVEKGFDISQLLSLCLGSFSLVVKKPNQIQVFNSVYHPGFFYGEKDGSLFLVRKEAEFYRLFNQQPLNDFEVLHFLLNHPSKRSPFKTLLKDTGRVIGGQVLEVSSQLKTKQHYYLSLQEYWSERRSLSDLEDDFEKTLETCVSQGVLSFSNPKTLFQLSGGIDSTVIILAAKQKGLNPTTYHRLKSAPTTLGAKILAKRMGVPLEFCGKYMDRKDPHWWNPAFENKDCFHYGLGVNSIGSYTDPYCLEGNPLIVGGHEANLYQVNHLVAGRVGIPHWYRLFNDSLKQKPGRLPFTKIWRRLTFRGEKSIYDLIAPGLFNKIPKNSEEYLLAYILKNSEPVFPERVLPKALKSLEKDFIDYRKYSFLNPILDNFPKGDLKDVKYAGKLLRLIRYSITAPSITLNYENFALAGHFSVYDPFLEGPMVHFFQKLPVGIREVFYPKSLKYRYFKKKTGMDYYKDYLEEVYQENIKQTGATKKDYRKYLQKEIAQDFKRSLGKKAESPSELYLSKKYTKWFYQNQGYRKHFLSEIDPNNSAVLDQIRTPKIKDYLSRVYRDITSGASSDFVMVNQIYNLEHFLKAKRPAFTPVTK